jgi:hypothetical protein
LSHLRDSRSPNLKRKVLHDFFDACLPETMKQLPVYIHHIYMLLDPVSTNDLIHLLEQHLDLSSFTSSDSDLHDAFNTSLSYLNSKRESLAIRPGKLPSFTSLDESNWSVFEPIEGFPTRRARLRILRAQWLKSRTSPSKLLRKVRFTIQPTITEDSEFVTAPEEPWERRSSGRSSSTDSREEWFVAPEEQGGPVEPGKSVAGLLREGRIKRVRGEIGLHHVEAVAEESEGM